MSKVIRIIWNALALIGLMTIIFYSYNAITNQLSHTILETTPNADAARAAIARFRSYNPSVQQCGYFIPRALISNLWPGVIAGNKEGIYVYPAVYNDTTRLVVEFGKSAYTDFIVGQERAFYITNSRSLCPDVCGNLIINKTCPE